MGSSSAVRWWLVGRMPRAGAGVEAVERGRAVRGAREALAGVDERAGRLHRAAEVGGVEAAAEHGLVHARGARPW